jgi:hypothetical protein
MKNFQARLRQLAAKFMQKSRSAPVPGRSNVKCKGGVKRFHSFHTRNAAAPEDGRAPGAKMIRARIILAFGGRVRNLTPQP